MSDYGGTHQATRRAALPDAYGRPCSRCGRPMLEGQALDLDHTDDRDGYRGFSHAKCNRSAGGKLGRSRQLARRRATRERITRMLTVCVLGLQISEDRRHTSVAAAGHLDGAMVLVELAAYLDGAGEAVSTVLGLRAERTVNAVVIDPHSPAATLIKPLTDAGVTVTQPSTVDVVVAHGEFLDTLTAGRLRHAGQPELDAAVRHGTQRPLAGANTWSRRGAQVDTSPLDAATLATWGLVHVTPPFFAGRWQ